MIIWLQEKDCISVNTYPDHTMLSLTGIPVHLCAESQHVHIQMPDYVHFTQNPIPYRTPVSFINRNNDIQGIIIIDPGILEYHAYVRKEHLIINETTQADLSVPSGTGYLHLDGNQAVGINLKFPVGYQGMPVQSCTVTERNCMFFYPFIIRFEKEFLLIHGDPVRLPLYSSRGSVVQKVPRLKETDGYQPVIETQMKLDLKEPMHVSVTSTSSFLRMFPSILMASASLSVALLNGARMMEQGKEIMDVVPMMMVPGAMMISCFVLMPLVSWLEKRKQKEDIQKAIQQYQEVLQEAKREINRFCENYEDAISFLNSQEGYVHQSLHSLYVLFPKTDRCLDVQIRRRWHSPIHELEQMADAFVGSIQPVRKPLALNLMNYASIVITGEKWMEGLRYLMQDIVMHARIPTAALVNSNSQELFWLRKIRTLHENGRRNIFHDAGALQEFAQSHPVCLCLVFTHDHIPSSKGTICLYLQYPLQPIQSDLLIRFEETITIHDYPNRRHWQLDYDERYHDLVSRCFTPSTHSFSIFQQETDFLSVHGVSDVQHLCIRENHSINRADRSLNAKIGIDENGNPVILNLHEKKDGPHGIVAGMTGSGKSELLLTLVLSIACFYSPQEVQFAFVDFKGGGLADQLKSLPHTAGVLSNLDERHFDKALSSFTRLCTQRQQLMLIAKQRCGKPISGISDYRMHWNEYSDLPYMSDLILIIDEFAELKKTCTEYMRDLITLARIGRSLGIHLILCTQKPSGNINEEILSNCSFRIVLKVADRKDSMEILGSPLAAGFTRPGQFLLYSSSGMIQGQAGYAGARTSQDGIQVEAIDADGSIYDSSLKYVPLKPEQSGSIIQLVRSLTSFQAEPLWTPMIHPSLLKDMDAQVFSMWDDISGNRHQLCHIIDGSWLFCVRNAVERQSLIHSLLFSAIHTDKDVIVSGYRNTDLLETDGICWVKDVQMDAFLEKMKTCQTAHMIWICADLPYRKNEHLERKVLFETIMEHTQRSMMQVMLIVNDASLLSMSVLHGFDHITALRETGKNTLIGLFETNSGPCRDEEGYGLVKVKQKTAEWCYRGIDEPYLKEALCSYNHPCTFTMDLPACIPGRIPIGKGEQDWLYADTFDQLIIASSYDNPLYEMARKLDGICFYQYQLDEQKKGIFLCDMDTARPMKYRIPILLLDRGSTYGFSSDLKIHAGQALLFIDRHSEVITLVNPKEYSSVCGSGSAESGV